jgi:hypothetical protein
MIYAQKYSVKNPYNDFFYVGMQTPLEVLVDGFSCKSTTLKASIGKIEKVNCRFIYYPGKIGIDTISIFSTKSSITKRTGTVYFTVKQAPDPEPEVGGLSKGIIKKGFLMAQQGVSASILITSYGHKENIQIDSFTVVIFRNTNIVFNNNNIGAIFEHLTKTAFESLQAGDKITITNIKATTITSTTLSLRPIEFDIQ